jgi:hypothetical protein
LLGSNTSKDPDAYIFRSEVRGTGKTVHNIGKRKENGVIASLWEPRRQERKEIGKRNLSICNNATEVGKTIKNGGGKGLKTNLYTAL